MKNEMKLSYEELLEVARDTVNTMLVLNERIKTSPVLKPVYEADLAKFRELLEKIKKHPNWQGSNAWLENTGSSSSTQT